MSARPAPGTVTLLAGYIGYPRASQAMETIHATMADDLARHAPPGSPTTAYTPAPEPENA
ncbi:hypothetical protein [Sinosporangium album]|nr:hypothetical protein [Sinosporangium album]